MYILKNTKSDIDTVIIIKSTCNSRRDTENSENHNESELTKITALQPLKTLMPLS